MQRTEEIKERIRRLFNKVELSVSAYDTAWVAMVPSPHYSQTPCFSGCVSWILENQLKDGSWGLSHQSVRLLKDDMSSTLACILALKRWGVGEKQINKGICFSSLNLSPYFMILSIFTIKVLVSYCRFAFSQVKF